MALFPLSRAKETSGLAQNVCHIIFLLFRYKKIFLRKPAAKLSQGNFQLLFFFFFPLSFFDTLEFTVLYPPQKKTFKFKTSLGEKLVVMRQFSSSSQLGDNITAEIGSLN